MMIVPPKISEIDFTFRCKIATYEEHEINRMHNFFRTSLEQRLKDLVGQHGIVSYSESTTEK